MVPEGGMKDQAKETVKKLVERFRYKWVKSKYWIYCLILTLAVISIIYYVHPNECPENARYILSAISQGLAAILALVFTITLVVAQMTRRYTAMDKIIFRHETKFLMIFFGIGIISPLLVLEFGFWKWGVPLSIVIASFCVFSLLPFLVGVNRVLKYDIGFVNLCGETLDAIKSGNEANVVRGIIDLERICKDAIKESRENVVKNILLQLSIIGKKSAEQRFEYATHRVVDGLRDGGIESIDKGFDDITTAGIVVDGLGGIGVEVAKNRPDYYWSVIVRKVTDSMESIGIKAVEKGFGYTTIQAVRGLKDVIVELGRDTGLSDMRSKYVAANAVQGVWCLGAFVTEYMPLHVDNVLQSLKEIEKEIGEDLLMKWGKNCVNKYPHLKSSFKEFKMRYGAG